MRRRCVKVPRLGPCAIPAGFDGFRIVGFVETEGTHVTHARKTRGILTCASGPLKTRQSRMAPDERALPCEADGLVLYQRHLSHFMMRRPYGHRTGQGSQDQTEAPQEHQADEGAGKRAAWKQEGKERVEASACQADSVSLRISALICSSTMEGTI